MSFLDLNLDDVYVPTVHNADEEVLLRITSAKLGAKKDDPSNQRIEVVFCDPKDDKVSDIYLYLNIPKEDTDKKKANTMKLRIRDFYTCFGIDAGMGVDIERDLAGHEGWVVVGRDDSAEFGNRNTIKRFCNSH